MATETPLSGLTKQGRPISARSQRDDEEGVSLLDLLIVLAERKRIIIWTTLIFASVALVVSLVLPKRYTAMVTLLPPQQNASMANALAAQMGGLGSIASLTSGSGLSLKNPNDMYVAMLKSRTVEDALVNRFGLMQQYRKKLASDARSAFEDHVKIDGSGKDGLIHLSVEDRDASRAAELANGYVAQFRDLSQHLAITEASQRRLFFEEQLEQAKENLSKSEEAMKQTEQSTGLIQLDSQARALIEAAATLRAQMAAKEVQIQGMRTYASAGNADLIQAQQELESMRSQLAKLGGSEEMPSDEFIVSKGRMSEAGLEYGRKLRDVKYAETIFSIIARQYEMAKLDEAKQGALIQVVDAAVPPDKRSFPKRTIIIFLATIAGFVAGIFFALLQAGFSRLKADPEANGKLSFLRSLLSFKGSAASIRDIASR